MRDKVDIESVRIVFLHYLHQDVVETETGFIIHHPVFQTRLMPFGHNAIELLDITIPEQYDKMTKYISEKTENFTEFHQYLYNIRSPYQLDFIMHCEDSITKEEFYKNIITAYRTCEFPNWNMQDRLAELIDAFRNVSMQEYMTDDSLEMYDKLNDEITIYRGIDYRLNELYPAISWTIDLQQALFFSKRMAFEDTETGNIYQAKISKKDILFCYSNESEVVVDFDKIYDVELMDKTDHNSN